MNDARTIAQLLEELGELRAVLDDLNVKYVTIPANGHWSFEKLGRTRQGSERFDPPTLQRLAELIPPGRHARFGEWALRKYEGVAGASILIERLPVAVADRLPQQVLATLKRQVKQDGNGVLVGQPGAGKGALLLWLALQIPDEPVVYVAENPPSEFPGNHIMHVFPPSTPQERRALERFVRLSPTVMWDRIASPYDLLTLFGFPGARRRWFTLDSSSVRSSLRMLTGAQTNGCEARISTMLALASSVIGRPEARNLLVKSSDEWEEPFVAGESCLDLIEAYETSDVRVLARTDLSVPGIPLADFPKVEISDDFAREAESFEEPVRIEPPEKREAPPEKIDPEPGTPSGSEDNPNTIPVEPADIEYDDADEAITGMLPKEEIRELREKQLARETGEESKVDAIEAPPALPETSVPEVTKSYVEHPMEIESTKESETQSEYLNRLVPGLNLEEESDPPGSVPAVNLDDLRITTIEDVDEANLEILDDIDELADDYSGVFKGDLDFDSLAEEMLSEISEVESVKRDSEEAQNPNFGATNPEQRIFISEDDIELLDDDTSSADDNRTVNATINVAELARAMKGSANPEEPSESTKEFTLNDRLEMLRRKRGNED